MPRPTGSPAAEASATFGRMPSASGRTSRWPRPDADGEDHEVGCEPASVGEGEPLRPVVAQHPRRLLRQQHLDAPALDLPLQNGRRAAVELALHQAVHDMHQRHVRAALGEPIGRLDAEQAAADDRDFAPLRGGGFQRRHILHVAEGDDAGEVRAWHGQHDRPGTRGENALVEGDQLAGSEHRRPGPRVDACHRIAPDEPDAEAAIPLGVAQPHVRLRDVACEQRRQKHAVVAGPRLRADKRDGETPPVARRQLLHQLNARHAPTDDQEPLLGHVTPPS
jgi:hypothetical protein